MTFSIELSLSIRVSESICEYVRLVTGTFSWETSLLEWARAETGELTEG